MIMNLFKKIVKKMYILIVPIMIVGVVLFSKPSIRNIVVKSSKYKTPANSSFTDINFYKCVIDEYNRVRWFNEEPSVGYDTDLSSEELARVKELRCGQYEIQYLDGIETLSSLQTLSLFGSFDDIDLSNNPTLKEFILTNNNNDIINLDFSHNPSLEGLYLKHVNLEELDLSNNSELKVLSVRYDDSDLTYFLDLDLSHNSLLEKLFLDHVELDDLDLSHNTELSELELKVNNLTSLNLDNNTKLVSLNIYYNKLTQIDLSHNVLLNYLDIEGSNISEINLSHNTILEELNLENNKLSEIDLKNNTELEDLNLSNNELIQLDLSHNTNLDSLFLSDNLLTELDLSHNPMLRVLSLGDNVYLSSFTSDYHRNYPITYNNQIKNINLEHNTALETLYIACNKLERIDLSHNTELVELNLSGNYLTNIDLKNNTELKSLSLNYNKLAQIDLSHNTHLLDLDLSMNLITNLNLSNNIYLKSLALYKNFITNIDLSYNTRLTGLGLGGNQLKYVDLSNTNLSSIGSQRKYYNIYNHDLSNISEKELKDIIDPNDIDNKYTIQYSYLINGGITKNLDFDYYINDVEITSNEYLINEQDNYIYTGSDTSHLTINSNIDLMINDEPINTVFMTKYNGFSSIIENNKYIINYDDDYYENYFDPDDVKYGYEVVKEFDLVNYASSKYNLSGNNIDVIDNNIQSFLGNITCTNCDLYVYDGTNNLTSGNFGENYTLRIVKGETILKEFSLGLSISGINIVEENIELSLGASQTLNVEYTPSDDVTWESSDTSVATISDGIVTAVGVGNATITVRTNYGNYTDTCTVTVLSPTEHSVVYKKSDGTIFKTEQFLSNENVIQEFADIFYVQGKKFIGWKYNGNIYSLDDQLLMPDADIELVAQYADVLFGNLEYDVDKDNGINYLSGIVSNTNISDLDNFDLDSEYIVKVYSGQSLKASGKVGTGDIIKVFVNDSQNYLVDSYTAVVKGDNNGDGVIDVSDVSNIYKHIKGKSHLYYERGTASNVNGDLLIDVSDISNIYKFIKGKLSF